MAFHWKSGFRLTKGWVEWNCSQRNIATSRGAMNIGTDAPGSHPVESFAVGDDVDKHQNTGGDDEHLARMKFFPGMGREGRSWRKKRMTARIATSRSSMMK